VIALLALLVAYVPTSGSLMRQAAARAAALGRARDVTMTGTLTVTGEPAHNVQLALHFPGSCAFSGEAALSVKGTTAEGNAGPALQLLQLACPLLTFRMVPKEKDEDNAIRAAAILAGVDLNAPTSLSRLVDRPVFVVGTGSRDLAKPQLWLYKDTHAAARLITNGGADLRLLEYGNPAALEWFPRVWELWSGGQLAARFEVQEARGLKNAAEEEDDSE